MNAGQQMSIFDPLKIALRLGGTHQVTQQVTLAGG